jgi:uroporphyrinogen-III synthase
MVSTPRRCILTTRPEAPSDTLPGLIQARGFAAVAAPMMRVRSIRAVLPRGAQAILVTSGNALGGLAPWKVKLLAVGDATADRAIQAGFRDVTSAAGDAAALVHLAGATLRPQDGPLLLLSGARQGLAVAASLRAAGFRVHRRVTYAAGPVPRFPPEAAAALAADTLHAVIFLSAETAAAFVRLLPSDLASHLAGVLALAIGKASADALKPLPWREIRSAPTPTLDGVLALL